MILWIEEHIVCLSRIKTNISTLGAKKKSRCLKSFLTKRIQIQIHVGEMGRTAAAAHKTRKGHVKTLKRPSLQTAQRACTQHAEETSTRARA